MPYDALIARNARRIAESERLIANQRSLIARLEKKGLNTERARELLAVCEDTLSIFRNIQIELEKFEWVVRVLGEKAQWVGRVKAMDEDEARRYALEDFDIPEADRFRVSVRKA